MACKVVPFHTGHKLHQSGVADIQDQPVDDLVTQITVRHLPALKAQRCLYLVAFTQKADSLILLGLVIVLINSNGELYFLDDNDLLLLACSTVALVLLVEIFSVVLNLHTGGTAFGEISTRSKDRSRAIFSASKGGHYAQLLAVLVDDADLPRADSFVGADEGLCGTLINRWNRSPPQQPSWPPCVSFELCVPLIEGPRSNVKYNICEALSVVASVMDLFY